METQTSHVRAGSDILPQEGRVNRAEQLQRLSAELTELRTENAKHAQATQKLEAQIQEAEIVCGRLLQNYLEIGRALEMKKRHVKEDKERLEKEQRRKRMNNERIDLTVAQISRLILENPD